MVQIRVVGRASGLLYLGKDDIVKRTVMCSYVFFLSEVVEKDAHHVFLSFKSTGGLNARNMKSVFMAFVYLRRVMDCRFSLL